MLIAWDAGGQIVATLDYLVRYEPQSGAVRGLVDFETHEQTGDRLRDIWEVADAAGSGSWPEWLGAQAHQFRVELDPDPEPARARVSALIHLASGHRRERAAVETAIEARIAAAAGEPADIHDLVGGPDRPLLLDEEGRTAARHVAAAPDLPIIPTEGDSP